MDEDRHKGEPSGKIGPLKRRDFLKMALGAGVVALAEACSPSQPQPTAAPAATAPPAAKPTAPPAAQPTAGPAAAAKPTSAPAPAVIKPTGTLTVAVPSIGNAAFAPTRAEPVAMEVSVATYGESLLTRSPQDRTLVPLLTESWSVGPDGKSMTFDLRKGIKFHDGTELTSADVKFTLEEAASKDSTNNDAGMWRDALDRIETPTPQRVVIYLKKRDIGLPFRLAGPVAQTQVIFSKSYIGKVGEDTAAQKPVGTGPWKFVEFRPGELARFEAVENHWRKTPAFKELILRQVPEEATRLAMVLRGEADLAIAGFRQAKQIQDGGGKLFVDPNSYSISISLQGQYLPTREKFDPKVPWAADPADKQAWDRALKVRKAMNIAIDRKAIIDTIVAGQGVPATYLWAVPGSAFEDPSWKPYPYDPDGAKKLLAEAGYPNGFEFPLWLVDMGARPGAAQMGEAAAQYWQAIGLRPKLSKADWTATVRPAMMARAIPGVAYTYPWNAYDEPAMAHAGSFMSTTGPMSGAEYLPLDDLVNKALATPDFEERKKIQLQFEQMVLDNYFVVPLAWVNGLWAASKRIGAFPRVPATPGLYNFEYVVPA